MRMSWPCKTRERAGAVAGTAIYTGKLSVRQTLEALSGQMR